jgi:hypothetical protein
MSRHRDDYDYDPDDDIDRDPDERYRRRVDRYGPEEDEEEEKEEQQTVEALRAARRKCLGPGILMIVSGVATLLGAAAFVVVSVTGVGGGAAARGVIAFGICAGLPSLALLAFSVLQILGGVFLLRQRARGLVIGGGILGGLAVACGVALGFLGNFPPSLWMVLGPGLLGIPAAVWMFVVLADPDVDRAFDRTH